MTNYKKGFGKTLAVLKCPSCGKRQCPKIVGKWYECKYCGCRGYRQNWPAWNKKYYTDAEKKEAKRISSQKYKQNNPNYHKEYYQRTKGLLTPEQKRRKREACRRYYEKNKDRLNEYSRAYYWENREKELARNRDYTQKNWLKLKIKRIQRNDGNIPGK